MTSYDKKGKITGTVRQEVLDKKESGKNLSITIKSTVSDKDNTEVSSHEYTVNCENGVFKINMKDYIDESVLEAYENMEIEVTSDNLDYPSNLTVEESLPDASINLTVKNNGMTMVNTNILINDRKVEAKESVTTEAGVFECYKIGYSVITKTSIITMSTSAIEWMSEGVGLVKSETYAKNGKLSGYSVLTKLEL